MPKSKNAFTILELLVVVTIIAILSTIATISTDAIIAEGRDNQRTTNVKSLAEALERYYEQNGEYPGCPTMTSTDLGAVSQKLNNLNEKSFMMPGYTENTNAIICADISSTDEDVIAYETSYSASCRTGESCRYFSLKFREESSGEIITIKSKHTTPTFAKTWGGSDIDCASSITKTSDGGMAIAGCTYSFDTAEGDAFIAKYSNSGALLWSRNWGGGDRDWANSVTYTSDNGLVLVGGTRSFDDANGDVFIAKFTNDGNLSWSKTWGGTDYESAYGAIQTSDGGLAVVGRTVSFGAGVSDAFILKYTANGVLSWSKTWGGADDDMAYSIIQTSDGGLNVVGATHSYGAGNEDGFIAKYTNIGELSWSKTWGGAGDECAGSIIQTSDNGLVIVGCTDSNSAGSFDAYITKIDSSGNTSWSKTWGGTDDDFANYVVQASDGGFIVVGGTYSFGAGGEDAFIAKYTPSGTLSWSRTWGGAEADSIFSAIQTEDDGIVVLGKTLSYGAGDIDNIIIKYQPDGTIDDCDAIMCRDITAEESTLTAVSNNYTVTEYTPSGIESSPPAISSPISSEETNLIKAIQATSINFNSGEMRINYPGEDQTSCKQWTAPIGKSIYGIYLNQETEQGFDYFIINIDGVEIYRESGNHSAQYLDTSSTPGSTVEACVSTDGSVQEGFGGEITGIYYSS